MCTFPFLSRVCRESYSAPEAVYERVKKLGMDLVTVTDHDSIKASETLRCHADYFVSEEVTCRMASGTEIHVAVYDITERQHLELQRRRDDLVALLRYLAEEDLFFSLQHVFSSLTGRRQHGDFEWFETCFPAFETLNGQVLSQNHEQARLLASRSGKVQVGGSDAHTVRSLGCAWTEVPHARNKREFLDGLRKGCGRVVGESGTYWKLTRDVLLIGAAMVRENPSRLVLAPLAAGIPAVTLINYVREKRFARRWARELAERRGPSADPRRSVPAGSEEAMA